MEEVGGKGGGGGREGEGSVGSHEEENSCTAEPFTYRKDDWSTTTRK